ncbi:MAG: hypothetical protein ACYC41_13400 [Bacillota bacterium]
MHEDHFFLATYLKYLQSNERPIVLTHLQPKLAKSLTAYKLDVLQGIGKWLRVSDVYPFVDSGVKALAGADPLVASKARLWLSETWTLADEGVRETILKRLQMWKDAFDKRANTAGSSVVQELITDIAVPF